MAGSAGSGGYAGTQTSAGSSFGGSGTSGSSSGGMSGGGMGGSGGTGVIQDPITIGQCKDDYWPAASNGSVTRYDFTACVRLRDHPHR
jgi:hypothetical protein